MSPQATHRQRDVLNRVLAHIERTGMAPSIAEIAKPLGITAQTAHQHLRALEKKGLITRQGRRARSIQIANRHTVAAELPIVGTAPAGMPLLAVENIEGCLPVDCSRYARDEHFVVRVNGNSMSGVGIADGDLAIIRKQDEVLSKTIALVLIRGDEATIKRFVATESGIELHPENTDFEIQHYPATEIRILGRVVGLHRDFDTAHGTC